MPALPFMFVGRWKEQDRTVALLLREGRSYRVDGAGPLDRDYAVEAVDERTIRLRYLPLGVVQDLRFGVRALDAPTTAGGAAATPAAPAAPGVAASAPSAVPAAPSAAGATAEPIDTSEN
jgi:hypothetical protein